MPQVRLATGVQATRSALRIQMYPKLVKPWTNWQWWLCLTLLLLSSIAAWSSISAFGIEGWWYRLSAAGSLAVAAIFLLGWLLMTRSRAAVGVPFLASVLGLALVLWQMSRLTNMQTGLIAYGVGMLAFGGTLLSTRQVRARR